MMPNRPNEGGDEITQIENVSSKRNVRQDQDEIEQVEQSSIMSSFLVVLLNVSLGVTSFLIVLPTSRAYTESFDINDRLAGLLVGLSPLINGAIQPLLIPIFQRFQLRHIFYANCIFGLLGNAFYSLGDFSNSYALVLVGRSVLGAAGGPVFATTYTARATSIDNRTKYMGYVSVAISSGYVLGPMLALVLEAIVNAAHWGSELVNSYTIPGFAMSILYIINLVLFMLFFNEPPRPSNGGPEKPQSMVNKKPDGEPSHEGNVHDDEEAQTDSLSSEHDMQSSTMSQSSRSDVFQIAICYLFVAVTMCCTGSFEIALVFYGDKSWGLSIIQVALLLAGFNFVTCLLSIVGIEKWIKTDRTGILSCFVGLAVASIWLFDYKSMSTLSYSAHRHAIIFGVGGLIMLYSAQTAKGFLYGLVSKVSHKQMVMSFMATFYTFGRFAGTLVAPFLLDYDNAYGGFILGINALCCVLFVGAYRHMKGANK